MFTKRHYEFLAKFLQSIPAEIPKDTLIRKLVVELIKDNPSFDRHKFLRACY